LHRAVQGYGWRFSADSQQLISGVLLVEQSVGGEFFSFEFRHVVEA
jgi:hypothetical protein